MLLSNRFKNDKKPGIFLNAVQENALYHYRKNLEDNKYSFEKYDCECGCSYEELVEIAEKDRYGIALSTKVCPKCGIVMTNPRMNQSSYNLFYDSIYRNLYVGRETANMDYFYTQRERGKEIIKIISDKIDKKNLKVLEIGCSAGGILSIFQEAGMTCTGIDLGKEYVDFGRKQGLNLINGTADDLKLLGVKFDLIILNHVLEHFLEIRHEFDTIRGLLADTGYLYISVPGIESIETVYGGDILRYIQNAHVRHFTKDTLNQLLKWNGFISIYSDDEVKGLYKKDKKEKTVLNYSKEVLERLREIEKNYKETQELNNTLEQTVLRRNVDILDRWLYIYQDDLKIADCLKKKQIKEVAVYGYGILGRHLCYELEKQGIIIKYIVDKNEKIECKQYTCYKPLDKLPKCDIIIIATSSSYYEIYTNLAKNDIKVITLMDLIIEVKKDSV